MKHCQNGIVLPKGRLGAKKNPFLLLPASVKQRLFCLLVDFYQQEQFYSLYASSIEEAIDGIFECFTQEEAFSLACLFDSVPFCLVKYQMAKRLTEYNSQLLQDVIERAFEETSRNSLIPHILQDFLSGNCPVGENKGFLSRAVLKFVLGAEQKQQVHCPLEPRYKKVISAFFQRQLGLE
jgi:hypothetical protein